MTPEQKAAFVCARAIAMLAEIEAMKAANRIRKSQRLFPKFEEDAFADLPKKRGLLPIDLEEFFEEN